MCAALQVQRQQAAQDFIIGHLRRVVVPAIGRRHRRIKLLVGSGQPGGALVVEVGQGALGQLFSKPGLGTMRSGVRTLRALRYRAA